MGQSKLIMLAVVAVTFIAGYSIVSFVIKKWKEGPGHPSNKNQPRSTPNSTSEETERKAGDAYHRSDEDG